MVSARAAMMNCWTSWRPPGARYHVAHIGFRGFCVEGRRLSWIDCFRSLPVPFQGAEVFGRCCGILFILMCMVGHALHC